MDAHNDKEFVSTEAQNYWQDVDLYIGGSEHATGHLLYSRFWNKFLKDRGYVNQEEPFKKLINQGMILGMSAYVYKLYNLEDYSEGVGSKMNEQYYTDEQKGRIQLFIKNYNGKIFISYSLVKDHPFKNMIPEEKKGNLSTSFPEVKEAIKNNFPEYSDIIDAILFDVSKSNVDVNLVNSSDELDVKGFKTHAINSDYRNAIFVKDLNGKLTVDREVEKMSKSKYNVVTPDDICEEYGADTLRLYEMFLGPLEQAKPWNTAGITGVFGFLKKLWKLYFDESGLIVTSNPASAEALKSLHKTIKKVNEDIEGFSFNTSVSQFMIAVNELTAMKCHERSVLEPLAILISPYAPHIAEELWEKLGHQTSISTAPFPKFNPEYLVESNKEYPVSFNGKMRFTLNLPLDLTKEQIEEIVMKDERTIKQLDGKMPNKVIIVPGKIINLVG